MKLLIFESHPVQYRAPVYRRLQELVPDQFEVIYGSDCSVKGHRDTGFGRRIAWDQPLLEGYPNRVLGNDVGEPLSSRKSLSGKGVASLIDEMRPAAVLLTGFTYDFDRAAFVSAIRRRVRIWIRMETQDEAFSRGRAKALVRYGCYRLVYGFVNRAFCIGQLNREHYLRHGIPAVRLRSAPYCTVDPIKSLDFSEKSAGRENIRGEHGLSDRIVIGFFGKLIPKKNPGLIFDALSYLEKSARPYGTLFVGSGELEADLRKRASELPCVRSVFAGFLNQAEIADYYLACDIVVLASRRAGETWGLVVNEALQAGCGVVVSDAVGCAREFGGWERVRVIPEGDGRALSQAIEELAAFERSFEWASRQMTSYSIEAAASGLAAEIRTLDEAR